MMRKDNPVVAEDGFHRLKARAQEYAPSLLKAFHATENRSIQCWLLELIGAARSNDAFELLCEQTRSDDESLRFWAVAGLIELDSRAARTFLFQNNLQR